MVCIFIYMDLSAQRIKSDTSEWVEYTKAIEEYD